jgi:hypothetical protein
LDFSWFYISLGCVLFFLIPFPYFNQSTETALTAMQITIWSAVMEEHQRNRQSDLCIQLGLEKGVSKFAITIMLFFFSRGENRIIKGTVYQWQNHIRKY